MKTILVVDDSKAIHKVVRAATEDKARCLEAEDLTEASVLFVRRWKEVDAILIDGSVTVDASTPNKNFTPEEWVRRLRRIGFKGPVIAFSASSTSRKSLTEAGCNAQFAKGEDSLADLLRLLGL